MKDLSRNLRFYVLVATVLLSIFATCLLRIMISNDQAYIVWLGQFFGFAAILYWYVVLLLSPLSKLIGEHGWLSQLLFARRAFGVSVAYFALGHAVLAVWGQLGGLSQLGLLPSVFQVALWYGVIALVMLLLMAAASFDAVIRWMSFPRWKWLQRLGYGAGVLVIAHIWLIGVHTATAAVAIPLGVALLVLFSLEALRVRKVLRGRRA
jgi:DMSO/TMAO reductase YedYZ heme-binding membrane subunit